MEEEMDGERKGNKREWKLGWREVKQIIGENQLGKMKKKEKGKEKTRRAKGRKKEGNRKKGKGRGWRRRGVRLDFLPYKLIWKNIKWVTHSYFRARATMLAFI